MGKNKLKLNLQFFSEEENEKDNNDSKVEQDKDEVTFTPEQQKKVDGIIERRLAKEKINID